MQDHEQIQISGTANGGSRPLQVSQFKLNLNSDQFHTGHEDMRFSLL